MDEQSSDKTPHRPSGSARTRIAPSPTGALHLGNIRTFLVNWVLAKQEGQRILLRIEDLDGPRTKPGADQQAIELLEWVGIDWDEGPIWQADNLENYALAMEILRQQGLAYPCQLSRTEAQSAASAPHAEDEPSSVFGIEQRPSIAAGSFHQRHQNHRFASRIGDVVFNDRLAGAQRINVQQDAGDFVIWRREALPAYQLAVVVDDARQGVTHVVRGDDLLTSTARQILLYEALDHQNPPNWCHLPLVVGADGRRLAKRHGDTRLQRYRNDQLPPERIVGLIARWCGVECDRHGLSASELASAFDLAKMPRHPIVFSPEDQAWLDG